MLQYCSNSPRPVRLDQLVTLIVRIDCAAYRRAHTHTHAHTIVGKIEKEVGLRCGAKQQLVDYCTLYRY